MWEVLCGALEVVRDLELEDLGRERFHTKRNPDFSPEGYIRLSGRQLFRVAFAVRRVPWRLAMIEVETDFAIPDMPREDDVALVAWVDGLTTIIRDNPPIAELLGPDDGTRGDNSLGRLLQPEALEVVVHPPWARQFEIAGSTLETDEAMFAVPGLITIGSDRYEAEFDADLGILTSWTACIDDGVATRFRVHAVAPLWLSPH
jgi:hypothetical protein